MSDKDLPNSFGCIVEKLKESKATIVTMVGAGISTSAGIPDFRSSSCSLYNKMEKYKLPYNHAAFEASFFEHNPEPMFALLKESILSKFPKPTKAHYFIKLLEDKGLLRRHYTQNIDGLDRSAGVSPDKLIEAHGSLKTSHCMRCEKEYSISWLRTEVNAELVPKCTVCSGVVKPDIILFGEQVPAIFTSKIDSDYSKCDLLIVMGTSLVVEPFASLITAVPQSAVRLFINKQPLGERHGIGPSINRVNLPETTIWVEGGNRDTIMHGSCDDCVEEIARRVGWEHDFNELILEEQPELLHKYSEE